MIHRSIDKAIAGCFLVWCAFDPGPSWADAHAVTDRILLASRSSIDASCLQLASMGVLCKFIPSRDIDRAGKDANLWSPVDDEDLERLPDLAVPPERMGLMERLTHYKFSAQLLIYPRVDPAGNSYFMGRPAVLKIFDRGSSSDPEKSDIVWSVADASLRSAPAESADSADYLKSVDEKAMADAAAAGAEKATAAAKAAYMQSPEYAKAQLQERAQSCRKTIAYAHSLIARDEKIAAISGYENKLIREQAAAMIVDCQEVIATANGAAHQK